MVTVGPVVSHGVTTSPGPSDGPLLIRDHVNLSAEPWPRLSTALQEQAEETRMQLENSASDLHMDPSSARRAANASVVFGGDGAASNNATERTKLDFLNATLNAELALLGPPTAAERSESLAEPQYRQFTTSSGDKDHQQQLKFIW